MIQYLHPYFHLCEGSMSYVLKILETGVLGHVYFGEAIPSLTRQEMEYMSEKESKSAGTVKVAKGSPLSYADSMLEYPVYGTSSFLAPALAIDEDYAPLWLEPVYGSYTIQSDKPDWMQAPQSRPAKGSETLILHLQDSVNEIDVDLAYTIYPNTSTMIRSAKITNRSNRERILRKAASGVLNLKDDGWNLIHLSGSWARERQVVSQNLVQGRSIVESLFGSSSHQSNPFTALVSSDPKQTRAYGTNLIYSSCFLAEAEVSEFGMTRLMEGIHPQTFSWQLGAEESFVTPEMMLMTSNEGLDGLSRVSSRFLRKHLINPRFAFRHRPVCLNSWEAFYFTLNENNLYELAREAAACGIECFVVDDGWFGKRNGPDSSLGDWYEDRAKFPGGLAALAQKIHALGLDFGLWFEPEMISEHSELYQAYPEYAIKAPGVRTSYGRSQLVLDFSNPEVVDCIFAQMKKVIEETGLDYIKWDMNRDITEAFSYFLQKQHRPQSEFFHRYIQGVYALYEKIEAAFPDVLIEACAAGGGRFDPGILYYSPQIWVSDNTDGYDRLKIQYGCSLAYPLSCMSNHVSEVPNHQTCRMTSESFRRDVAFFGIFGYEMNLLKEERIDVRVMKEQIAAWKELEPAILNGDFYHIESPFDSDQVIVALAYKKDLSVGIYQGLASLKGEPYASVSLPFVKDGTYRFHGRLLSASLLRGYGLRLPLANNGANQDAAAFKGDFCSAILSLKNAQEPTLSSHNVPEANF